MSKAKHSLNLKNEVKQKLNTHNLTIFRLQQEISKDRPRKDDGLKKKLLEMLEKCNDLITIAQKLFQYPDMLNEVGKIYEKLEDCINQTYNMKTELLKKPLLVSMSRNPR